MQQVSQEQGAELNFMNISHLITRHKTKEKKEPLEKRQQLRYTKLKLTAAYVIYQKFIGKITVQYSMKYVFKNIGLKTQQNQIIRYILFARLYYLTGRYQVKRVKKKRQEATQWLCSHTRRNETLAALMVRQQNIYRVRRMTPQHCTHISLIINQE